MQRRLILAIALSFLVILLWSRLVVKQQPIAPQAVTPQITPAPSPAPEPAKKPGPPPSLFHFTAPRFQLEFLEQQAAIKEATFPQYKSGRLDLANSFAFGPTEMRFQALPAQRSQVGFTATDKDKEFAKRFIFSPDNPYTLEVILTLRNLSNLNLPVTWPIVLATLNSNQDPDEARYQDITVVNNEKTWHLNPHKEMSILQPEFVGIRNRYFCLIVQSEQRHYNLAVRRISRQESEILLVPQELSVLPGGTLQEKFRIYLGPQDLQTINRINPNWGAVLHYGTFNIIGQMLSQLLEWLYRGVHNWGLVIIILSVLIYLLLFPLTLKQMRAMKAMQALQPRLEELKVMYKDNPQRLNKEMMELYREHKVNPLGGCLPLVLQIPVFFALYQVFMRSVALKGAKFLWIKDLSEPDRLFALPRALPVIGNEINILPIIMALGMFVQQKLSMATTASAGSQEQQKIMLVLFPLMFGLIFYKMPAGLVLYWFLNSTLMLLYQWRVSRSK
jgi:YidC/Oxa1 family membrane protein insertase